MVVFAVVMVAVLTPIFRALGSFEPVWADAWIFTGSLLATYAMARGWVEFWLIWIAVDAVGVPLLLRAHLYPSAILYAIYAGFVLWGFVVWLRVSRAEAAAAAPVAQVTRCAGPARSPAWPGPCGRCAAGCRCWWSTTPTGRTRATS